MIRGFFLGLMTMAFLSMLLPPITHEAAAGLFFIFLGSFAIAQVLRWL